MTSIVVLIVEVVHDANYNVEDRIGVGFYEGENYTAHRKIVSNPKGARIDRHLVLVELISEREE